MRSPLITILLFIFSLLNSSLIYPKTQDDYFYLTINTKYVLSALFDSSNHKFDKKLSERLLNDLSKDEFVSKKQMKASITDFQDVSMLKSHYDITDSYAFMLYINNQMIRFDAFAVLAQNFILQKETYDSLLAKTISFIKSSFERINAEITSLEQFNSQLSTHKIIAVYLGQNSVFFAEQFQNFSEKHIKFNFYHVKDNFIADQIFYQKTNLPRPQSQDIFAIIRDSSLVNDIDDKALVSISANKFIDEYELFFEYEQFPKLRDQSHGDEIFFSLYNKNEKLILYVHGDDSPLDDFNEFRKAVFLLPKVFIFSHVNLNSAHAGSYLQMFIQAAKTPLENRVYILHTVVGKMIIEQIPAEIYAEKIIEGVNRFYEQNRFTFKKSERNVLGGEDWREEEVENEENGENEGNERNGEMVYDEL
jgi:hypothetical protein